MQRTHTCGALRLKDKEAEVTLFGWVQRIRHKGKLIWLDLRDRYGVTQIVLEETVCKAELFAQVKKLSREDVLQVEGIVLERYAKNNRIDTGEVEIQPTSIVLLNKAQLPPFLLEEETDGGEELRMQYRYLDLRRTPLQRNLCLRHAVNRSIRNYLDKHGFLEVDTPTLIKPTPEGARDFVVPTRHKKDHYYALPQSPQLLKQLLMVGSIDRYYQIAHCYRDEDLRADRQPEFTQLDCELSFVTEEYIQNLFEGMIKEVVKETTGEVLTTFPMITYAEAMDKYGTDKPDLRWAMPLHECSDLSHLSEGSFLYDKPYVGSICLSGGAQCTRKQLDRWQKQLIQKEGDGRLITIKWDLDNTLHSSLLKQYDEKALRTWFQRADGKEGDLLISLAGEKLATQQQLGTLRLLVAQDKLEPKQRFAPLWVTDFPLLEWNEEVKRYVACHHPFTAPLSEDLQFLASKPEKVRARAYDLILNGVELGGGSIRIHKPELQRSVLHAMGYTDQEIDKQFGFLLQALNYGAPPHGGIAFGIARICMLLGGGSSIRDYIAFPKNNMGRDTMLGAPLLIEE